MVVRRSRNHMRGIGGGGGGGDMPVQPAMAGSIHIILKQLLSYLLTAESVSVNIPQ